MCTQVHGCKQWLDQGAETGCVHRVQGTSSTLGSWRCSHSPVHIAACKGFAHTVELLLQRGAELNRTCEGGETALAVAVLMGHSALVQLLLHKVLCACEARPRRARARIPTSRIWWVARRCTTRRPGLGWQGAR